MLEFSSYQLSNIQHGAFLTVTRVKWSSVSVLEQCAEYMSQKSLLGRWTMEPNASLQRSEK